MFECKKVKQYDYVLITLVILLNTVGIVAIGVASWIGFQAVINIGVTTGLIPNTGITLPFVSYGLTSLLSLYIAVGLVLNVYKQYRKNGRP